MSTIILGGGGGDEETKRLYEVLTECPVFFPDYYWREPRKQMKSKVIITDKLFNEDLAFEKLEEPQLTILLDALVSHQPF